MLYWCARCIDSVPSKKSKRVVLVGKVHRFVPSQKSKRRCFGVLGATILYQARTVSGVVLVGLVHRLCTKPEK